MKRLLLMTVVLAMLAGLTACEAQTLLGSATGGAAIYYDSPVENPGNIAYIRSQASATNTAGATFDFPNTAPWPAYGPTHPFQVHAGQFGLDFILPVPGSSIVAPTLNAYDWNPTTSQTVQGGPVMWAINGYSGSSPINSLFRGSSVEGVTMEEAGPANATWAVQKISGWLVTDGYIHWYSDFNNNHDGADDVTALSTWGWSDRLWFEGTLAYDNATSGMDFYSGNINVYTEATAVPEPMSIMLGIMGLGSIAGFRKLRLK